MIEIFFDNVKDSVGVSVESSILTEAQTKRLVSEWAAVVMDIMPPSRN